MKVMLMPALLIAACLCAGLYGVLHDQISYTASPDYFFAFKFHQFRVPLEFQNRAGAAMVGWMASWWMGILIGIPLVLLGLILPNAKSYAAVVLQSFLVVTATAMAVGLGALLIAYLSYNADHLPPYTYPNDVQDKVAFARVGTMHNFSYAGGALGIGTGCGYIVWRSRRMQRKR